MSDETILQEIINGLPTELQGVVGQYLPVIAQMTIAEIMALVDQIIQGKTLDAHRAMVAKMDNVALLAEIDSIMDDTQAANEANAEQIAQQKKIATAVCTALLSVCLGMVGKFGLFI